MVVAVHIGLVAIRLVWSSIRRLWVQAVSALAFVVLCRVGQGAAQSSGASPFQTCSRISG